MPPGAAGHDNTLGAEIVPEPRIMNPLPNSRYEIDPELPRTQQMIELTATIGNDVRWYREWRARVASTRWAFFLAACAWRVGIAGDGPKRCGARENHG